MYLQKLCERLLRGRSPLMIPLLSLFVRARQSACSQPAAQFGFLMQTGLTGEEFAECRKDATFVSSERLKHRAVTAVAFDTSEKCQTYNYYH